MFGTKKIGLEEYDLPEEKAALEKAKQAKFAERREKFKTGFAKVGASIGKGLQGMQKFAEENRKRQALRDKEDYQRLTTETKLLKARFANKKARESLKQFDNSNFENPMFRF